MFREPKLWNHLLRTVVSTAHLDGFKMRQEDAEECLLSSGLSPEESLKQSCAVSSYAWAILDTRSGECVCVFGLRTLYNDSGAPIGIPWSLYSTGIKKCPKGVLRLIKEVNDGLLQEFAIFYNIIHARNTTAIRWVKTLGYTVDTSAPIKRNGGTFYTFYATPIKN